jgi:CheY-like chemotaxis protein
MPGGVQLFLVVEDDDDEFELIKRAFARAVPSLTLHREVDGQAAVEFLTRNGQLPSVIISDLMMPRMNGLELLSWVRNQPSVRRIPFVLWSNQQPSRFAAEAMRLGATAYSVKPRSPGEVSSAAVSIAAIAINVR